ncbi:MAG: hypothetical protein ACRD3W_22800 [Terriglobales bacterium]
MFDKDDDWFVRPENITRRSDPPTSLEAASGIIPKLTDLQYKTYDFILDAGSKGTTSWHVEEHFGNHGSTYRTRIAELCGKGAYGIAVNPPLVRRTGERVVVNGTAREIVVAIFYDMP